jgi:ectoine hydroxylase-related dioxygenase (phytanoyl-CoA dioxygenase family)
MSSDVTAVEAFDESWYTTYYSDVGAAVAAGEIPSGLTHYISFGRQEGRLPSASFFDGAWYAASYPMARVEVGAGRAADYYSHYLRFGKARGYLPNLHVKRPPNPSAPTSRFGGLWPDHENAIDLVDGKREIGAITELQAEQITHWIEHGYIVLKDVFSSELLDAAEAELDRAYRGEIEALLFSAPIAGQGEMPWNESISRYPAKALDLHWLSPKVRDLIFSPGLRSFLELIFERRALASQTLTFLRGSAQAHHLDTLYVPYTLPTQFAASWIALEDVTAGAGELCYFEGSHKLPEHLVLEEYKSVNEAMRMKRASDHYSTAREYEAQLPDLAKAHGMPQSTFIAKRGEVLIWHAGLAHGGMPISQQRTRKSVVTHYCPREVASLAWEYRSPPLRSYQGKAYYTTGYYGADAHR